MQEMTPFMSAMSALEEFVLRIARFFTRERTAPKPRYCQLFIDLVALLIHIRRQADVSDEQKALIRTLLGTAQRILTPDEWAEALTKANMRLREHPPVVGHWLDARDSLEVRMHDVD
jgi:hypothetical protein